MANLITKIIQMKGSHFNCERDTYSRNKINWVLFRRQPSSDPSDAWNLFGAKVWQSFLRLSQLYVYV